MLVYLSEEQRIALKGNQSSPMPGIVVSVWENEYPQHPTNQTGINVRVFTDSNDNPLWLTSLPMKFDGSDEMFGKQCATYIVGEPVPANPVKKMVDGIPRRSRLDLNTPAELAITNAMQEVEKAGCHTMLTDAINLLQKAKDCVSDYVDAKEAAGV